MNQAFLAAQRIALRYIGEKISEASTSASRLGGMEEDEYECFNGWFNTKEDFEEWMRNQGYNVHTHGDAAWASVRKLLRG